MRPASPLRYTTLVIVSFLGFVGFVVPHASSNVTSLQEEFEFQNLQVLPSDTSRDAVLDVMLTNLEGLGLPRRDGEGCLYCHVGAPDTPRQEWDYASDEKVAKRKARRMMAMVQEINERHLEALESRVDTGFRVTCATCHAGRTDPRPLTDLLQSEYEAGGVDALLGRYRELRERYYAADAYDFRPGVLSSLAGTLVDEGGFDDALAVAEFNARLHPEDASVNATVILLDLRREYQVGGVEAVLAGYARIASGARARWVSYRVLDALGWGLSRRDQKADALALFRSNLDLFPDEYIPHESLADALYFDQSDIDRAIEIYAGWLERHPDHEVARRRLMNLREEARSPRD